MRELEKKRAAGKAELKATDDNSGVFTGYGAVFDEPHPTSSWMLDDDWKDVMRVGCFERTLAEHKARGTSPAMCLQHASYENPIGVWRELKEDDHGLFLRGQLAVKTEDGAEVYELMKIGALTGLSIGFRPVKVALDEGKKLREILDVELWEISPVTIPGNPGARVEDVKSAGGPQALLKRKMEEALRERFGASRTEAKAFIAEVFSQVGRRDVGPDNDVPNALRDAAADGDLVERLKRLATVIHP